MLSNKISVKTKNNKYDVIIEKDILKKSGKLIKKKLPGIKKIAIITDKKLPSYIVKELKFSLKDYICFFYSLSTGEKTKNMTNVIFLINKLLRNNFSRSDCILALGGGVIGDLSGLVASLVKRGIRFVNIPTTLLAQVDASIGGKTGVNAIYGKNMIGTFYQPNLVISDTKLIKSLPHREVVCGYAEILKHALILDAKFFSWLKKNGKKIIQEKNSNSLKVAITKSCKIKSIIVQRDEKEKNLRMILNLGHTFGHAFESVKKYSKNLNHGEAVLLGMMMAAKFSFRKKLLSLNDLNEIKKHYFKLDLPYNIKKYFKKKDLKKIFNFMKNDKKNIYSKINLILLKKNGKALIYKNTKEVDLKEFLNSQFI